MTDRSILSEGIDLLTPEAGTAIGDGIALAVQVAKQAVGSAPRGRDGKRPAAIVLLSDGAQTRGTLAPLQGADRARDAGIRVFTVALGTDHAGFALKAAVMEAIRAAGHEPLDCGAFAVDPGDDYPDFAERVAQAVLASNGWRNHSTVRPVTRVPASSKTGPSLCVLDGSR